MQSGFRKNHGTDTALLLITNDLISMLDEKKIAILTLLDFTKAFDSVNREFLAGKLSEKFGFTSSAVVLISSYLSDRLQYVEANGKKSNFAPNFVGVPQGSILGPLLFSLFINDLPDVVRYCKCHMFADDVQLYLGRKSFAKEEMVSHLNFDLQNIVQWAKNNQLLLNPSKSKCVIFAQHDIEYHRNNIGPIKLLGENIEVCRNATNLGLTMDSGLTWNNHTNNICGRIYGGLRSLRNSAIVLSQPVKIMLVKTLLMPHIIYCSPVMGLLHDNVYKKIQKSFYAALRFIYNVPRITHMTEYAIRFLGCTLKIFLKYRICLLMHKIISSRQPDYLSNNLRFGNSERLGRLLLPRNHSRVKNDSFFVYMVYLYTTKFQLVLGQ